MAKYFKLTESFTTHDWFTVKAKDEADARANLGHQMPISTGFYFSNASGLEVKEISREEAEEDDE